MIAPERLPNKVERVLERHRKLKDLRQPWLNTWQLVGEYVMTRKQDFVNTVMPGELLTGKIFDSTAPNANHLMTSLLIGTLWPNGAKTFSIEPPDSMPPEEADSDEVKKYYEHVTRSVIRAMENSRAGWLTSFEEYMLDQGAFGVSGIGVYENNDPQTEYSMPVTFQAHDAKKVCIAEGKDGFVDTVYIEYEYTIRQLVQEFGVDNISQYSRDMFNQEKYEEKVKVLHAVEPRMNEARRPLGNQGMPVASLHIEIDKRKMLRESGYQSMPIFITRFWKTMGEVYGRSPGMEGMPDIIEANLFREASIIATEKYLDPPLWINDEADGEFDNSPGALNFRRQSGRVADHGRPPVEQIVTTTELNSTYKRITELREIIRNNFFIDRLSDLNNEERMTLGEAQIRNELRGYSLGTIYSRQMAEMLSRVIERVFEIMFGKGMLGVAENSQRHIAILSQGGDAVVIPEAVRKRMVEGEEVYRINYVSPAARVMKSEELAGIQRTLAAAAEIAAIDPGVLDTLDLDQAMREIQQLTGAPSSVVRDMETVRKIREAKQQQAETMAQLQAQHMQAETAKKGAQAVQAAAKAQVA